MRIVSTDAELAIPHQQITRSFDQQAPADYAMAVDLVGHGWTVGDLAEVLFCTSLQPSEAPDPRTVLAALAQSVRRRGNVLRECAAEVATRYGDDPDTASRRMRWSRAAVVAALFTPRPELGLAR